MTGFHITLHARPAQVLTSGEREIGSKVVATVHFDTSSPATWESAFEDAAARLTRLPRMFFELDGSFVCSGENPAGDRWQLEGQLYDRDGHIVFLELKGNCPEHVFDEVLSAAGPGPRGVVIQLTQQAVFVSCEQFRQIAFA